MRNWRKIHLPVLVLQGLVYRCFIILCNIIFFLVGIKSTGIVGQISFWETLWYALVVSLSWNLINMGLYYLYHYIWARRFKLGK